MRLSFWFVSSVLAAGMLQTQTARGQSTCSTLYELCDLGGGDSWGWAITGQNTAGRSKNSAGNLHAFFEPGGAPGNCSPNPMTDLGTLGGAESQAFDISSNSNRIVGQAMTAAGATKAFFWPGSGTTLYDLGTLGGTNSNAYGINHTGWIVGRAQISNGQYHAFRWDPGADGDPSTGTMTQLGPFPGGTYGSAQAISNASGDPNTNRVVVGGAYNSSGQMRPFRVLDGSTTMTQLNLPSGSTEGQARAINVRGWSAGFVYNGVSNAAARWAPPPSTTHNSLGSLGGFNSFAYAINCLNNNCNTDDHYIVGTAQLPGAPGPYRAFRWKSPSGPMQNLNEIKPSTPGVTWVLEYAMDISETGAIVGRGTKDGVAVAFVLSGCPN